MIYKPKRPKRTWNKTIRDIMMELIGTLMRKLLTLEFKLNRQSSVETLQAKKDKKSLMHSLRARTDTRSANRLLKTEMRRERHKVAMQKNRVRRTLVIGTTGKTLSTLRSRERRSKISRRSKLRSRRPMAPRKRRRRAKRRRRLVPQEPTLWTLITKETTIAFLKLLEDLDQSLATTTVWSPSRSTKRARFLISLRHVSMVTELLLTTLTLSSILQARRMKIGLTSRSRSLRVMVMPTT